MNRELYKPRPLAASVPDERLPWAADLIPDIFIQLNRGPASQKNIIAALVETHHLAREAKGLAYPTGDMFRAKVQAAVSYLLSSRFIEREFKKGPFYLTDEGSDFLRKLSAEAIQGLSKSNRARFQGARKGKAEASLESGF